MFLPDSAKSVPADGFSQICSVDVEDRLTIPAAMLREMPWWEDASCEVICEMACLGLVRITGLTSALEKIDALKDSRVKGPSAQHDRQMALLDKFRPLKLYKDGRLRLTAEVMSCLEFETEAQPRLYVQKSAQAIEILSFAYWVRRLSRHESETIGAQYE